MKHRITDYTDSLARERGLSFDASTAAGYDALWRWSVSDLRAFWRSVWDYFELQSPTPVASVLADETIPGARWFDGARVNYAQQVFRHGGAAHATGHPAIVFQNEAMAERGEVGELGWPEFERRVASLAAHLRAMGVDPGDRVAAFLPNTPQTAIAFLAVASLGAVWSVCSPDMGPVAVLDRFRQIEPKVLIACEGYRFGGVAHDRLPLVREMLGELPSVRDVVLWRDEASTGSARMGGKMGEEDKPFRLRYRSPCPARPEVSKGRTELVEGPDPTYRESAGLASTPAPPATPTRLRPSLLAASSSSSAAFSSASGELTARVVSATPAEKLSPCSLAPPTSKDCVRQRRSRVCTLRRAPSASVRGISRQNSSPP
jgi:hypothetical protein